MAKYENGFDILFRQSLTINGVGLSVYFFGLPNMSDSVPFTVSQCPLWFYFFGILSAGVCLIASGAASMGQNIVDIDSKTADLKKRMEILNASLNAEKENQNLDRRIKMESVFEQEIQNIVSSLAKINEDNKSLDTVKKQFFGSIEPNRYINLSLRTREWCMLFSFACFLIATAIIISKVG